jgi:hypothetical protein
MPMTVAQRKRNSMAFTDPAEDILTLRQRLGSHSDGVLGNNMADYLSAAASTEPDRAPATRFGNIEEKAVPVDVAGYDRSELADGVDVGSIALVIDQEWLTDRADRLAARLHECGRAIEQSMAREVIARRALAMALEARTSVVIARRDVTDGVIDLLADRLAGMQGSEVTSVAIDTAESQTAAVSFRLIGRAVAGLAEATLSRLETTDVPTQVRPASELLELLQFLGDLSSDSPLADKAIIPSKLLLCVAGGLDVAATQPGLPAELAAGWRRDAIRLRAANPTLSLTDASTPERPKLD